MVLADHFFPSTLTPSKAFSRDGACVPKLTKPGHKSSPPRAQPVPGALCPFHGHQAIDLQVHCSSGLVSFFRYSTFCLVPDRLWNTRHPSQGHFCTQGLCWNTGMLPGSVLDPSGFCPSPRWTPGFQLERGWIWALSSCWSWPELGQSQITTGL